MRTPNLGLLDHVAGPARGGATDWWMRIPAIRLADAHATTTSATHMCEFGWPSPQFGGRLGAVHGLEIPFIFDTLDQISPLFGPLLGADPPQHLADTMHAAWIDRLAADADPAGRGTTSTAEPQCASIPAPGPAVARSLSLVQSS